MNHLVLVFVGLKDVVGRAYGQLCAVGNVTLRLYRVETAYQWFSCRSMLFKACLRLTDFAHTALLVVETEVKILHGSRDKLFRKGNTVTFTRGLCSCRSGLIYGFLSLAIIYVNELRVPGKCH